MTNYNNKAVNVDAYQRRNNNSSLTQQEKVNAACSGKNTKNKIQKESVLYSATVNNAWNQFIMDVNMDKITMEITRYKTEKYHLHSCKQWRIAAIFQLDVQDEHKQIFFSSLEAFKLIHN